MLNALMLVCCRYVKSRWTWALEAYILYQDGELSVPDTNSMAPKRLVPASSFASTYLHLSKHGQITFART
jgi:hypothetical protein